VTGQRSAWYGYETQAARLLERDDGDVAACQLDAIRAIGYALLSLREHLADRFTELADAVTAAADQGGDLAVPAGELAGSASAVLAAARVPGKSAAMRRCLPGFLRRHPGAGARVYDLKDPGGEAAWARDLAGPAGLSREDAVTLTAGELATVRQALVDAAAWQLSVPDGACGCAGYREDADCPGHSGDDRLAAAYADLLVRLLACLDGGGAS
jgi:hypothetical protein